MKHAAASAVLILSLLQTTVFAQLYSRIPAVISSSFRAPDQTLITVFAGGNTVQYPGQAFSQQQVSSAPTFGLPDLSSSLNTTNGTNSTHLRASPSKYAALLVDPNVNNSVPTNVILHYLLTDLSLSPTPLASGAALTGGTARASYRVPSAQNIPHNYTALLFVQPPSFSVPANYTRFLDASRAGFPLTDFLRDSGLGTAPLAATYFMEGPGTGNTTMGNANGTARGTGTAAGTGTGAAGATVTSAPPYRASTLVPPITSTATATEYVGGPSASGSSAPTASASGRVTSNGAVVLDANVGWSLVLAGGAGVLAFLL